MSNSSPSSPGWLPGRSQPAGEPPELSPAVVTLVRHRIASGFYDSKPVQRAIAERLLPEWPREPRRARG